MPGRGCGVGVCVLRSWPLGLRFTLSNTILFREGFVFTRVCSPSRCAALRLLRVLAQCVLGGVGGGLGFGTHLAQGASVRFWLNFVKMAVLCVCTLLLYTLVSYILYAYVLVCVCIYT